ncbi:MAG: hypothetical protein LBC56_06130 [Oscillospiraceae bacterium]|nr:hypothetical protein [Oscillospiraceae bacterium]
MLDVLPELFPLNFQFPQSSLISLVGLLCHILLFSYIQFMPAVGTDSADSRKIARYGIHYWNSLLPYAPLAQAERVFVQRRQLRWNLRAGHQLRLFFGL